MSKTHLQTSHSNWTMTKAMIESLNAEDLLNAAKKAELHEPITDSRIKEFLKLIARIGATAPGSDEKKSYLLAQLKSSMVYYGCPLIFFTINPGERHSPIALLYAGEEIDIQQFDPHIYTSSDRLKTMLRNPLAVVEYFHRLVKTIIETCFKGGMFGELSHYYGTIEYQGRFTPHIHMAVCLFFDHILTIVSSCGSKASLLLTNSGKRPNWTPISVNVCWVISRKLSKSVCPTRLLSMTWRKTMATL